MRKISSSLDSKLKNPIQAPATNAQPSVILQITRPTVPLTTDQFLERELILDGSGSLTDCDIAACHPTMGGDVTRLWVAYIDGGMAHVVYADAVIAMQRHTWIPMNWSMPAESVAIAFNGRYEDAGSDRVEVVTEKTPWVFWIHDGALYSQRLDTTESAMLAAENASSVTAIRATSSDTPEFDYGLCVFFLLNGVIYYRQLIGGTWYDAEPVPIGPEDVTFERITAFRTWDYRVGLQALTADGTLYELFSQFQGFAKRNNEHLQVSGASEEHSITPITYTDAKSPDEHLEVSGAAGNLAPYGGSYQIGDAAIVEAWNIPTEVEDEETHEIREDWGLRVCVRFDREISEADAVEQVALFGMLDSQNHAFYPSTAEPDSTGRVFTFTFSNFNNARGDLTFGYIPGTVGTMAGYLLLESDTTFTPQNLVPIVLPAPVPVAIWNE